MNILLIGPQGSGKGTQAKLLVEKFNFFYFEMGGFLRGIAKNNEKVEEMLNKGVLVPDEEATSYVTSHLDHEGIYDNILFDGFPRTVAQYQVLKNWFKAKNVQLDMVFVLHISEEESIKRLSARRTDPKTGDVYNLITKKPPPEVDVNTLIQRDDDRPEAIKKRLEIYNSQTKTLLGVMKKDIKIIEVDGERSIDVIQKDLVKIVEKTKNG